MPHNKKPVYYDRNGIDSLLNEAAEITNVFVSDADRMQDQFNRINNKKKLWYDDDQQGGGGFRGWFENILGYIKKMLFQVKSGGGN